MKRLLQPQRGVTVARLCLAPSPRRLLPFRLCLCRGFSTPGVGLPAQGRKESTSSLRRPAHLSPCRCTVNRQVSGSCHKTQRFSKLFAAGVHTYLHLSTGNEQWWLWLKLLQLRLPACCTQLLAHLTACMYRDLTRARSDGCSPCQRCRQLRKAVWMMVTAVSVMCSSDTSSLRFSFFYKWMVNNTHSGRMQLKTLSEASSMLELQEPCISGASSLLTSTCSKAVSLCWLCILCKQTEQQRSPAEARLIANCLGARP